MNEWTKVGLRCLLQVVRGIVILPPDRVVTFQMYVPFYQHFEFLLFGLSFQLKMVESGYEGTMQRPQKKGMTIVGKNRIDLPKYQCMVPVVSGC